MTETWAVIPTRGRPDVFRRTLQSVITQVDGTVIIDNNDEQQIIGYDRVVVIHHPEQPPNLSRMINIGMVAAAEHATGDRWNVALLNDDVTVPPGWVRTLDAEMRATDAAAAYITRYTRPSNTLYTFRTHTLDDAMTCWACLVRGELGLLWDEDLRWWYGDNAFDLACRRNGGVLAVNGAAPVHHHPDAQTLASPELSALAHADARTYAVKYGM